MDRKIEVGDEYRLEATVSGVDQSHCWLRFGDGTVRGFPLDRFAAHATLVKAAERPLAVGELVRLVPNGYVGEIIAIVGKRAWVEFRNGIGAIRDLDELTRVEPT